jgi:hypothetical protein
MFAVLIPRRLSSFCILATVLLGPVSAAARDVPHTDVSTDGFQTSLTRLRGSDKNAELTAVGFSTSRVGFGFERPFTVRIVSSSSLALHSKGIQGGFAGAMAGGARIPTGRDHGILLRAGLEGSIFGNKYLWDSLFEVPQVHVGYQWVVPGSVFDIAAKSGYVLWGRHNTGDAAVRRLDGAPELGGIAYLHANAFDVRASYSHVIARHEGAPINLFEAALCGFASAIVICSNTRYEFGDVNLPRRGSQASQVAYLGLSIGVVAPKKKKP